MNTLSERFSIKFQHICPRVAREGHYTSKQNHEFLASVIYLTLRKQ